MKRATATRDSHDRSHDHDQPQEPQNKPQQQGRNLPESRRTDHAKTAAGAVVPLAPIWA